MSKIKQQCPVCYEKLENREVSPCWDCGASLKEVSQEYTKFKVFGENIVLCNFCMVDFSSYDAGYFGLSNGKNLGLGSDEFIEVAKINLPQLEKDLCCTKCNKRLSFLNWVSKVRSKNSSS